MLFSKSGTAGAFSAPHHLAAQTGRDVLREGGSAIEAMVAAAATIAVVYPHMNGIGGDGFWLIQRADKPVVGIEACGRAAKLATPDWYKARGHERIPTRGPHAVLTTPGTIGGWQQALDFVPADRRMPLGRLLADATAYCTGGFTTSWSQSRYGREKSAELLQMPGFADAFMPERTPPAPLSICKNEALARTFATLAKEGLRDFYDGSIARLHADYLGRIDSPLGIADFESTAPRQVEPIEVGLTTGRLYNMPPPTQGISSLLILALFERLAVVEPEGFGHVHGIVEATKQAFMLRNAYLGDPDFMPCQAAEWLDLDMIAKLSSSIDVHKALRWPHAFEAGDTVWMGAADRFGTIVSFIQSIYWEFGSGVVCPDTGVVFQNRGSSFTLTPGPNQLMPGRRPFHTLNPALAHLNDGRWMAYGTMGGEGQPQTQAAVYSRYAMFGRPLQAAITAPRWLLGRTWGDQSTTLKLERRFPETLFADLSAAGHTVQWVDDFSDAVGHAGGVVMHPSGVFEAAADPRSDGTAVAL